ncbi:uncharacterized protein LOC115879888 [Sitophilus oryzae]|uniref:Uncharacterized protein LOC115879888 n=1 Tax=Sitophilus oryzae TaxID=7048 RepID=A0A6J2XQ49_SITOR|nr:uncharacterized protein LOC115879888 [Sitophilus oryzae]
MGDLLFVCYRLEHSSDNECSCTCSQIVCNFEDNLCEIALAKENTANPIIKCQHGTTFSKDPFKDGFENIDLNSTVPNSKQERTRCGLNEEDVANQIKIERCKNDNSLAQSTLVHPEFVCVDGRNVCLQENPSYYDPNEVTTEPSYEYVSRSKRGSLEPSHEKSEQTTADNRQKRIKCGLSEEDVANEIIIEGFKNDNSLAQSTVVYPESDCVDVRNLCIHENRSYYGPNEGNTEPSDEHVSRSKSGSLEPSIERSEQMTADNRQKRIKCSLSEEDVANEIIIEGFKNDNSLAQSTVVYPESDCVDVRNLCIHENRSYYGPNEGNTEPSDEHVSRSKSGSLEPSIERSEQTTADNRQKRIKCSLSEEDVANEIIIEGFKNDNSLAQSTLVHPKSVCVDGRNVCLQENPAYYDPNKGTTEPSDEYVSRSKRGSLEPSHEKSEQTTADNRQKRIKCGLSEEDVANEIIIEVFKNDNSLVQSTVVYPESDCVDVRNLCIHENCSYYGPNEGITEPSDEHVSRSKSGSLEPSIERSEQTTTGSRQKRIKCGLSQEDVANKTIIERFKNKNSLAQSTVVHPEAVCMDVRNICIQEDLSYYDPNEETTESSDEHVFRSKRGSLGPYKKSGQRKICRTTASRTSDTPSTKRLLNEQNIQLRNTELFELHSSTNNDIICDTIRNSMTGDSEKTITSNLRSAPEHVIDNDTITSTVESVHSVDKKSAKTLSFQDYKRKYGQFRRSSTDHKKREFSLDGKINSLNIDIGTHKTNNFDTTINTDADTILYNMYKGSLVNNYTVTCTGEKRQGSENAIQYYIDLENSYIPDTQLIKCIVCLENIESIDTLAVHFWVNHRDQPIDKIVSVFCEVCGEKINTAYSNNHFHLYKFECVCCNEAFENTDRLMSHYIVSHPKDNKEELEFRSIGTHHTTYFCNFCGAQFFFIASLFRHKNGYHSNILNILKMKECADAHVDSNEEPSRDIEESINYANEEFEQTIYDFQCDLTDCTSPIQMNSEDGLSWGEKQQHKPSSSITKKATHRNYNENPSTTQDVEDPNKCIRYNRDPRRQRFRY